MEELEQIIRIEYLTVNIKTPEKSWFLRGFQQFGHFLHFAGECTRNDGAGLDTCAIMEINGDTYDLGQYHV